MSDKVLDRAPTGQELMARLEFTAANVSFAGKAFLDFGCGTALAPAWMQGPPNPGRLTSIYIPGAERFARTNCSEITFYATGV